MYRANVQSTSASQFLAKIGSAELVIGTGGAGAIDTLLASLCACVGHHVKARSGSAPLTLSAEGDLTDEGRSLSRIILTIKGTALSHSEIVAEAEHCPVYSALHRSVDIDIRIS